MRVQILNYTQAAPASTWTITHNFGCVPVHDVMVSIGDTFVKVLPLTVKHTSENVLTITFSEAKAGKVRLIGKAAPEVIVGPGSVDLGQGM